MESALLFVVIFAKERNWLRYLLEIMFELSRFELVETIERMLNRSLSFVRETLAKLTSNIKVDLILCVDLDWWWRLLCVVLLYQCHDKSNLSATAVK